MTLTPDKDKISTQINVLADKAERAAITKTLDDLRDRLVFDVDADRQKYNKKALQGAADETGATDPIMYIKLDNFFREFRDAIASDAAVVDATLKPNEISSASADPANMRQYTNTMNKLREALDQIIVKRKDKSVSGLFGSPQFRVKAVYDLALAEDLTAGRRLEEMIAKGKVVPEYGATKIPASASRRFYEPGSYKYLMNRAYVVIVEDEDEQGLIKNFEQQIKIDGGGWRKLMNYKQAAIQGVDATTLSAYKDIRQLRPNTKLDVLQMATSLAVGQNEGLMGPRPVRAPLVAEYVDPDINQPRKYYIFTIGGYKGTRTGAKKLEIPEDVAGIPNL